MNNKEKETKMKQYKEIFFMEMVTWFKDGVEIPHPQGLMTNGNRILEPQNVEAYIAEKLAKYESLGVKDGFKVVKIEDRFFADNRDEGMEGYVRMFGTASE